MHLRWFRWFRRPKPPTESRSAPVPELNMAQIWNAKSYGDFRAILGVDTPRTKDTRDDGEVVAGDMLRVVSDMLNTRIAKEFGVLLRVLAEWIERYPDHVRDAYLTMRERELLFLVVEKDGTPDAEFDDALSRLELELHDNHELERFSVSTMSLPPVDDEGLASFVDQSFLWQHGEGGWTFVGRSK